MSIKLTDAQLVMMNKAAQRDDRCLTPPIGLRGATLASVEAKLKAAGLVREFNAKSSMPIWRRDEAKRSAVALKLTPAGLKAIAIEDGEVVAKKASQDARVAPRLGSTVAQADDEVWVGTVGATKRSDYAGSEALPQPQETPGPLNVDGSNQTPRPGTKLAEIVSLLSREEGASLLTLIDATGWLSHTTRAALTGLRQRGYAIVRDRPHSARGSVYRIGTTVSLTETVTAAVR